MYSNYALETERKRTGEVYLMQTSSLLVFIAFFLVSLGFLLVGFPSVCPAESLHLLTLLLLEIHKVENTRSAGDAWEKTIS